MAFREDSSSHMDIKLREKAGTVKQVLGLSDEEITKFTVNGTAIKDEFA